MYTRGDDVKLATQFSDQRERKCVVYDEFN